MAIFIGRNISESTETWLKKHKVDYVAQPLIDIHLIEPDYVFFQKIARHAKLWLITSKWAALWLQHHYKNIGFQSSDSVFCLSEKQADVIRTFSDVVFVSSEKNLQSLSELVQQKKQNKLCLCLKGNRSLKASGLETVEVEVYQNSLSSPKVDKQFEAYLFFSPSGIESFIQAGNQIPKNARIITIGETTAKKAKSEFENEIIISEKQTERGMVELAYSVLKERQLNTI